jgi:hypothetical protein
MMATFLNLPIFIRDTMTIGTPRMTRPSSILDPSMATYEAIWSPQAPLAFMFHWAVKGRHRRQISNSEATPWSIDAQDDA